jgi:hypothetical protein
MSPARVQGIKKMILDGIPKTEPFRAKQVHGTLPLWAQEKYSVKSVAKIMTANFKVEHLGKHDGSKIWVWRGKV